MTAHVAGAFEAVVLSRTPAADGIQLFELASASGDPMPLWTPGSHIDVLLPDGDARQYSLCGRPGEPTWRIGVLLEEGGRGGSRWMHSLGEGDRLTVAGPRNHFEFVPEKGTSYVFIAGGIGITPIAAMIDAADRAGVDWRLIYAGRSRSSMALLGELEERHPGRVEVFAGDEGRRLDLESLYADLRPFTTTFCCGPARLIAAVESAATGRQLKVERFEPREVGAPVWAGDFEVELAYSGVTVTIPPERSVLEAIEDAGVLVLSSCREGTCGTCETPVMEGEVDHRDSILTPDEQAANQVMYPCVSRAACPRLVLEL